ncbi:hypothetical protein [Hahella chejuensis]|nr:hypothetical protein [Hahella chejuensis]
MKGINDTIKAFMQHYAEEFKDSEVLLVLEKESIESENEANSVLNFLDSMCKKVQEDMESGVVVLNQKVHTTDAEKVCDVVEDYIEGLGYEF